ncbi:hypothetical protein ACFL2Q_02370 [Thermodesulfobacteriota bacterium]
MTKESVKAEYKSWVFGPAIEIRERYIMQEELELRVPVAELKHFRDAFNLHGVDLRGRSDTKYACIAGALINKLARFWG